MFTKLHKNIKFLVRKPHAQKKSSAVAEMRNDTIAEAREMEDLLKETPEGSPVIGRKSVVVMEQELLWHKEQADKWRQLSEKYFREKMYLLDQFKKEKRDILKEMWSLRTVVFVIRQLRSPEVIGGLLLINFLLISYVSYNVFQERVMERQSESLALTVERPYTIQIDALNDFAKAQAIVAELKKNQFNAYIGKIFNASADSYRVYVGEFSHTDEAYRELKKVKNATGYQNSFVRRKY